MISNYAKLKILLSGDQDKDPFWRDILLYRQSMGLPVEGFETQAAYTKWRNDLKNGRWSKRAAQKELRPRPGVVFENIPQIAAFWFPKYDFRHFNRVAFDLAKKYRLNSTGSVYKKLTDVLLYNDIKLAPRDVTQPVDILTQGKWDTITAKMYFVFNTHTRTENFIKYAKEYADVIRFFQRHLRIQKEPPFTARLNSNRQAVEVQIFRNTKPSVIKKSWAKIQILQRQLDKYTPRIKDPNLKVLLAIDQIKSWRLVRVPAGWSKRRTMDEILELIYQKTGVRMEMDHYKQYKRMLNAIKKGG